MRSSSKIHNDWNFLNLFHSSRKHLKITFTFEFDHFEWLSQLYSERRQSSRKSIWRFLLRSGCVIKVKIRKSLKLLNSVPFIKKTLVDHFYIRIWSSWLTFTVLQWMKTNFKIRQFSSFLLRSIYPIEVKIWKWLKLLSSVPFIKKTLVNQIYIRIWYFWMTFTVLQWMKKNSKISQFSSFLLMSREYDLGQNLIITKTS